jgi:GWxTD domain-containing protein
MKRIAWIAALAIASRGLAQGPPPGTPPGEPINDVAVRESLAVLVQLDAAVRAKPRDAAIWYHRGMVAWALTYRGRIGPAYAGLDWTRLGRTADSSIRIALNIDGSNPRVLLTAAQLYLSSGQTAMRVQAYRYFTRALELARKGPDKALLAEALIEQGRVYWRRYDTFANRRIEPSGGFMRSLASDSIGVSDRRTRDAFAPGQVAFPMSRIVERLNQATQALPSDLMGAGDYEHAEQLFREAALLQPNDARAFRQLAMLYAEKKRWQELANLSRDRVRRLPKDGPAWMTLGLALQRTRKSDAAASAYDSAFAALDPRERANLKSLRRVMPTQDEAHYASLTAAERERDERLYWKFADPLWSRGGNDAYTEFLTRVTYADLRWTVEELGVRGIDSDRGLMHVRYGPPDVEAVLGPSPARGEMISAISMDDEQDNLRSSTRRDRFDFPGPPSPNEIAEMTNLTTLWGYQQGWLIIFRGAPTYATARIPPEDVQIVADFVRGTPASWRNAGEEIIVDMPTQVARFRGQRDSVAIVVASEPPVADLREQTSSNALIRSDFWLFGADSPNGVHDSSAVRTPGARAWRYSVPHGVYAYRIEATADGALLAGRSTDWIDASTDARTGFATQGFGTSDVLLVGSAAPRPGARRWNDIDVDPIAGSVGRGGQIALVWENYELGQAEGSAKYGVTVTIERRYKQAINRIRARVIGAFAAMAGVERTDDRVVFRYERSSAHAPTLVDYLTIGLEDSPAGEYRLTLDITDHVSGKTSSHVQRFVIRE